MNLKEVKLSFDRESWIGDYETFGPIPKKIQDWCNKYFIYNHSVKWADDLESIIVTLHNVPPRITTWLLLSTPNISIIEQVNYAPIAPEVLDLFDFGDTK